MRKSLEAISLAVLAAMVGITWEAFTGPIPLQERIPTHFDALGNPNGWGPPAALWLLPAVAVGLYLLMTLVARFPSAFNYPVRVTAENRPRLEALALAMVAWIKIEMVFLFAGIQWFTIAVARRGHGSLPPAVLPVCLVVVLGTVGWFIAAMHRAGRRGSGA
jgi:hypothetical protein